VIEVDLRVSEPLEAQPLERRALGVADPRLDLSLGERRQLQRMRSLRGQGSP